MSFSEKDLQAMTSEGESAFVSKDSLLSALDSDAISELLKSQQVSPTTRTKQSRFSAIIGKGFGSMTTGSITQDLKREKEAQAQKETKEKEKEERKLREKGEKQIKQLAKLERRKSLVISASPKQNLSPKTTRANPSMLLKDTEDVPMDVRMRNKCVNEVITTERDYVEDLRYIVTTFITPMRTVLSAVDVQKIFSNLETLLGLNEVRFKI